MTTLEIDCHDHPLENEVGGLATLREDYDIETEALPNHPLAAWAWWYRITGSRECPVDFLADQYTGCEIQAIEMIDGGS
jgi:hypothetical protein